MAPSKLRKAIGAVKDQTSIGLAKVSNSASISDLEVTIVKATRHDEYPAEEKHIREILSLTCYSRSYISTCIATLSRRLSKTRSWTVALKTLILIHRLLTEGDPAYEQEIFFSTRRGTRMLNMSDFRDTSRSDAWDFSAFVRTYARYLDERLEYRMHGRRMRRPSRATFEEEDLQPADTEKPTSSSSSSTPVQATPVREMKTDKIFVRTKHLQQLLERFLACRPTGAAKNNRIVAVALYPVVKESYQLYLDLQELVGIYVDRFMELQVPDCIKVYEIFCRLSKQFDELDLFYSWCKTAGISRPSEFPEVDKITQQKLDVMDEFIRDKSILAQTRKLKSLEQLTFEEDQAWAAGGANEEPSDHVKALPAPEKVEEATAEHKEQEEEKQIVPVQKAEEVEVDFLNLRDEAWSVESHADELALALFDGHTSTPNEAAAAPAWEAFADHTADWETALVQSASNLSGLKPSLGGGLDMLLLDGMYSQPRPPVAGQGTFADGAGSASSMAPPKATASAAAMLALPAPPATTTSGGDVGFGGDPFVASLAVPAPAYVQMSDMERKQQLMTEEQMMWQQYAMDRTQGQLGIAKLQQAGNLPMGGGYIQRF